MVKIGTHNSGTGEASRTIFHSLWLPFARCQNKTIKEQYNAGCRWFDLRARMVNGVLRIAHGPWTSKRTLDSVIKEINSFNDPCVVTIMYEGKFSNKISNNSYTEEAWITLCNTLYANYTNIVLYRGNVKKPIIRNVWKHPMITLGYRERYVGISKQNRNRWLPIPIIWKWLKYPNPEFSTEYFTIVDFL